MLLNRYEKADQLLLEAIKHYPEDMTFHFVIIENSIRAGNEARTSAYFEEMCQIFNEKQVMLGLETYTDNPKYAPISKNLIEPAILDMFEVHRD